MSGPRPPSAAALPLLLGLALAGACSRGEPGAAAPVDPAAAALPPQRAIAGIWGLRARSRVEFDQLPGVPHALTCVFAFPGRAFVRLQQPVGRAWQRRLVYRLGDEVHHVPPEAGEPQRVEGAAREELLLQLELRAAALLWPDGHAWDGGSDPARVELPGLGWLEARGASGPRGRPTELSSHRRDGSLVERLGEIEWEPRGARSWPLRWELSIPTGRVWREEIEEVQTIGTYADAYFVPPERMAPGDAGEERGFDPGTRQLVEIPARTLRREALSPGASWLEVLAEARARRAERSAEPGPELEERAEVELDAAGRPVALYLRLREPAPEAPPGWERRPEGRGASVLLESPRRIDAAGIAALGARLPRPGAAGTPYVLLELTGDGDAPAQLVVPLRQGQ